MTLPTRDTLEVSVRSGPMPRVCTTPEAPTLRSAATEAAASRVAPLCSGKASRVVQELPGVGAPPAGGPLGGCPSGAPEGRPSPGFWPPLAAVVSTPTVRDTA